MKTNGIYEYFSDGYNVFDFSMPIFYIVHIAIRIDANKKYRNLKTKKRVKTL